MQDYAGDYEEAGIGMVVETYDSPELQEEFVNAGNLTYQFISDIDAMTINALGILNEQYSPGDPAYGIPHPGVFVIDLNNKIVGKIFIENFRERVDGEGTLNYALEMLKTEN